MKFILALSFILISLNSQAALFGSESSISDDLDSTCYGEEGLADALCRTVAAITTTTSSLTYLVGDLDTHTANDLYEECVIAKTDVTAMNNLNNFIAQNNENFSAEELCAALEE